MAATPQKFDDLSGRNVMITVHFAAGQNVSDAADVRGLKVVAIRMPATWTSAGLAAYESPDDAATRAYNPVFDDGGSSAATPTQWILATSASQTYLVGGVLDVFRFVKLKSVNTASAAGVNQVADTVVDLLCEQL